jgi:hypothetical protein
LKAQHEPDTTETVSAFLLSIAGMADVRLRKNSRNELANLTLRTVSHFYLVGESRIIGEHSPILSPRSTQDTVMVSALKFFLTGEDDRALRPIPDAKIRKAQLTGKAELAAEMLKTAREKIAAAGLELGAVRAQLNAVRERLGGFAEMATTATADLADAQRARRETWERRTERDSRLLVIGELLTRFKLLRAFYESDLRRLDFVTEGEHLFAQLELVACPTCGTNLATHALVRACESSGADASAMKRACDAERTKITSLVTDLDGTVASLEAEGAELRGALIADRDTLRAIDERITGALAPAEQQSRAELATTMEEQRRLEDLEAEFQRIDELQQVQASIERAFRERQSRDAPVKMRTTALAAFEAVVRDRLVAWDWLKAPGVVRFDAEALDLVVNDKPRAENGKGVRALFHAAFTIGLMDYTSQHDRPHLGFVVLDSPLTTLKKTRRRSDAEADEVEEPVQAAFFAQLAETTDAEQIIILENKEPTPDVQTRINYVEFSGDPQVGRPGFYPLVDRDESGSGTK